MKTILVDDERDALDMLEIELNNAFPLLEIIGKYQNPIKAIGAIQELKPDIVFLDVQMPAMNGIEVLNQIDSKAIQVIFLTAFGDFAIDAIKAQANDYLLKPIDTKELIIAVSNARRRIESSNLGKVKPSDRKLNIPTLEGVAYVKHADIILLKAESNYCKVISISKEYLVSKTLKYLETQLDSGEFIRTHKSYLVHKDHILAFHRQDGGYLELTNGHKAYISRAKKELVLDLF